MCWIETPLSHTKSTKSWGPCNQTKRYCSEAALECLASITWYDKGPTKLPSHNRATTSLADAFYGLEEGRQQSSYYGIFNPYLSIDYQYLLAVANFWLHCPDRPCQGPGTAFWINCINYSFQYFLCHSSSHMKSSSFSVRLSRLYLS